MSDTFYVPLAWLTTTTNVGKAEWYSEQQLAVITGQYTPEAENYGIFAKPVSTLKYNIYKDWEIQPNQPFRYLSKNLVPYKDNK